MAIIRWLLLCALLETGCGDDVAFKAAEAWAKPPASTCQETVTIAAFDDSGRAEGVHAIPKIVLSDEDWQARMTPLGFAVTRRKATELAYTGRYDKHWAEGVYRCAACSTALFPSSAKFDSGTGWPSFTRPIAEQNVYTRQDDTREEVLCRRCDAHLGHLFFDGPEPARTRYCMNSAALVFASSQR